MGEFHGLAGIAAFGGQGWKRDGMRTQSEGVVSSDHALIAQAEAAGEIEAARQGAEVARSVGWGAGKALVVVGTEASEHGVGLRQGGGAGETEFADQTMLAGAPGAPDAALGLRRVGGDLLDAEFLQGASELGGRLFSGEGAVGIIALEDAVALPADAERDAM